MVAMISRSGGIFGSIIVAGCLMMVTHKTVMTDGGDSVDIGNLGEYGAPLLVK